MIHVCSLARLHATVNETRAQHVVTLLKQIELVTRPPTIEAENHLHVMVDDIAEPMDGHVHPCEQHVAQLIEFVQRWPRATPLVVHCYAGISRSTAAAFISACALAPGRDETSIALAIRQASPTAYPNPLLVTLADRQLGRGGRMVRAVEAIGRGTIATEGVPFRLDIG
jgi:predicted protein tyrosine phosphatase